MHQALLYYASLSSATPVTAKALNDTYVVAMNRDGNWAEVTKQTDPYMAFLSTYVWGSNGTKAHAGNLFAYLAEYNLGSRSTEENLMAAANYLHYLHGVNPLGKVYLTNMGSLGAENSVDQIYHSWFSDGSPKWDSVKNSLYGPAPGFLAGGPNPGQYNWDDRCPGISPLCGSAPPSPPLGQPDQKSYKDFNDGWPLNSWPISENSNGYQTGYIRLLARFVNLAQ